MVHIYFTTQGTFLPQHFINSFQKINYLVKTGYQSVCLYPNTNFIQSGGENGSHMPFMCFMLDLKDPE